eukprot:367883-Hanusia_phi.AAC.2
MESDGPLDRNQPATAVTIRHPISEAPAVSVVDRTPLARPPLYDDVQDDTPNSGRRILSPFKFTDPAVLGPLRQGPRAARTVSGGQCPTGSDSSSRG